MIASKIVIGVGVLALAAMGCAIAYSIKLQGEMAEASEKLREEQERLRRSTQDIFDKAKGMGL